MKNTPQQIKQEYVQLEENCSIKINALEGLRLFAKRFDDKLADFVFANTGTDVCLESTLSNALNFQIELAQNSYRSEQTYLVQTKGTNNLALSIGGHYCHPDIVMAIVYLCGKETEILYVEPNDESIDVLASHACAMLEAYKVVAL